MSLSLIFNIAAVGILVYAQGFGFMQLYNGPMMMGFTSVAAVLIGGKTAEVPPNAHGDDE